MESLPKDIQEKILNELSVTDFIKMCGQNDVISQKVCNDEQVWRRRFERDCGPLIPDIQHLLKEGKDYKTIYLEIFSKVFKTAEELKEAVLNTIGKHFEQFLTQEYKEKLSKFLNYYVFSFLLYILSDKRYKLGLINMDVITYGYYNKSRKSFATMIPGDIDDSWRRNIFPSLLNFLEDVFFYFKDIEKEKKKKKDKKKDTEIELPSITLPILRR